MFVGRAESPLPLLLSSLPRQYHCGMPASHHFFLVSFPSEPVTVILGPWSDCGLFAAFSLTCSL